MYVWGNLRDVCLEGATRRSARREVFRAQAMRSPSDLARGDARAEVGASD